MPDMPDMLDKPYYYQVLIDWYTEPNNYYTLEFETIKEAQEYYKKLIDKYIFENEEIKIYLYERGRYYEWEYLVSKITMY